jgi:tRNA A-37 threonylcarbamoyl transferase component Bud32
MSFDDPNSTPFPLRAFTETSVTASLDESGAKEVVIPLWPYGLKEELAKRKNENFAAMLTDGKSIAVAYAVGWTILSFCVVGELLTHFAFPLRAKDVISFSLVMPAALAALLFVAFKFSHLLPWQDAAYLRMYKWGLSLQWVVFGKVVKEQQVYWQFLHSIHLETPEPSVWGPPKPRIVFETTDGIRFGMSLQCIPDKESWSSVLQAAHEWGETFPIIIDPAIASSFSEDDKEACYTELWLEALTAAPERERLQPLAEGTYLKTMRFKIIRQLAAGGQGTAYLAEDNDQAGTAIVLKEYILPVYVDLKSRRYALDSLEHEATILRSLNHANIVKLTGFFVEDHRAYLVEEYIKGESLRSSVTKIGPAPPLVAVRLGLVMADTLAYLHSRTPPVVHRDFTPDNLLYDQDSHLKLIDFTVAQRGEAVSGNTVVGKQAYLPPEQFRGRATTQSDIYAMGATLYFLLTGTDPEALTQLQLPIGGTEITDSEVFEALNAILSRATALDLSDRYQRAEEIKSELALVERFLSGSGKAHQDS